LKKQFLDCNPACETCDYECNPAISNKRTRFIQAHNRVGHSHILTVAKFFRLTTHKMAKLSAFCFLHKTTAACSLTPYLTNSLQHISKELFIQNMVLSTPFWHLYLFSFYYPIFFLKASSHSELSLLTLTSSAFSKFWFWSLFFHIQRPKCVTPLPSSLFSFLFLFFFLSCPSSPIDKMYCIYVNLHLIISTKPEVLFICLFTVYTIIRLSSYLIPKDCSVTYSYL